MCPEAYPRITQNRTVHVMDPIRVELWFITRDHNHKWIYDIHQALNAQTLCADSGLFEILDVVFHLFGRRFLFFFFFHIVEVSKLTLIVYDDHFGLLHIIFVFFFRLRSCRYLLFYMHEAHSQDPRVYTVQSKVTVIIITDTSSHGICIQIHTCLRY